MKNKLNFPVKAAESPVNLSEQFSSSHAAFVVWWYGGVTKNDDFNQPKVILVLREFLADNRLGEYFTRSVPITLLGQARIGTIWKNGCCIGEVDFETAEFEVSFDRDGWHHVSFYDYYHGICDAPYPLHVYPLKYTKDKNYFIKLKDGEKRTLLVPCLEFFSRCYGSSQEIKRILAKHLFRDWGDPYNYMLSNFLESESDGVWNISIKGNSKLVEADARFLAWLKYNKYAKVSAKDIYAQMDLAIEGISVSGKYPLVHLKVRPWHEQRARIRVQGISFDSGRSFLALNILGCSPPAGPEIKLHRLIRGSGAKATESVETIPASYPGRGKRDLPSGKLPVTSRQNPDRSGPRKAVEDPEFVELAHPDVDVSPIGQEKVNHSSGAGNNVFQHGESFADRYSSDDRFGNDKGVGEVFFEAPLKLQSKGMLRDMWDAFCYLRSEFPHKILKVEWFTFRKGFCGDKEPELIALEPFDYSDDVPAGVRGWPYLYSGSSRTRGALVVKITTLDDPIYVVEIERRLVRKRCDSGGYGEISMSGLCFSVRKRSEFEDVLARLLSDVRYKGDDRKGKEKKDVIAGYPEDVEWFSHKKSKNKKVVQEAAAKNALRKMGLTL